MMDAGRHPRIELLTYSEVVDVQGYVGNFTVRVRRKPRYVREDACTGCAECEKVCPVSLPSEFNLGLGTRKAIYRPFPQAVPNAFTIDKRGVSPCKAACPIGTSAQGYIALIAEGRFQEALEVSRRVNPFTSVCGRICYHPCEEACNRGKFDQPVAIAALKRFLADYAAEHGDQPVEPVEVTREEKVAVVGAGPAGLTAAQDLALLGYSVTVYEAMPEPGGMLRYGIPAYRLPKDVLAQEIKRIADLGVRIITNHPVEDVEALLGDYDAVFVAVGAHKDVRMGIEGEDLEGVYSAIEFLRKINMGQEVEVGKRVYVVGGGNTAIDAARSCMRLGADVTILYRRSRAEMPAHPFEVAAAEEEGVRIEFLVAPTRVIGRDGRVARLECIRMELGEPDETGRRRPIPIPGSEFIVEADSVILAIGQRPDLSLLPPDVEVGRRGIVVDPETMATSREGIFAGGDAVTGPRNAVEAIAAGHRAAEAIHRYLSGEEVEFLPRVDEEKVVELSDEEIEERLSKWGVERGGRAEMPTLPLEKRLKGFDEVELGLTEEQAIAEARRCLACAGCSECLACEKVCGPKCIDHRMEEEYLDLKVGVIVLATGYDLLDAPLLRRYGYGVYENVIDGLQFERLASPSGPTGGRILLKNGQEPRAIAFLHCVGSRDERGVEYCSRICCMYTLKQAHLAREKTKAKVYEFYIDMRAGGKGYEEFYERIQEEGIHFIRGKAAEVERRDGRLVVRAEDTLLGRVVEVPVDMVVLATGMVPAKGAQEMARLFNISCSPDGFFLEAHPKMRPVGTHTDGIFLAGCCQGPKDIPDTVAQASAAATQAIILMNKGVVEIEPITAEVRPEFCSGCRICLNLCPYAAIGFDEERGVAEVNPLLCKGCGICVAACPSEAVFVKHFTTEQILAQIEGALAWR